LIKRGIRHNFIGGAQHLSSLQTIAPAQRAYTPTNCKKPLESSGIQLRPLRGSGL